MVWLHSTLKSICKVRYWYATPTHPKATRQSFFTLFSGVKTFHPIALRCFWDWRCVLLSEDAPFRSFGMYLGLIHCVFSWVNKLHPEALGWVGVEFVIHMYAEILIAVLCYLVWLLLRRKVLLQQRGDKYSWSKGNTGLILNFSISGVHCRSGKLAHVVSEAFLLLLESFMKTITLYTVITVLF